MIINIADKEIKLRNTFRSHIIYEGITGHTFAPNGLTDIITFFYSDTMAADSELSLTFEEFVDWLDAHPDTLTEYAKYLTENIARNTTLSPKSEEKKKAPKDTKKKK